MLTRKLFKFAGVQASQKLPITLGAGVHYSDFVEIGRFYAGGNGLLAIFGKLVSGTPGAAVDVVVEGSAGENPVADETWAPTQELADSSSVTVRAIVLKVNGTPQTLIVAITAVTPGTGYGVSLPPFVRLKVTVEAGTVAQFYATFNFVELP